MYCNIDFPFLIKKQNTLFKINLKKIMKLLIMFNSVTYFRNNIKSYLKYHILTNK